MIIRLYTLLIICLFSIQGFSQNKKELLEIQISRTDSLVKIIQKIQAEVVKQDLILNSQKMEVDSLNDLIFRLQNENNTTNAEITKSLASNRKLYNQLLDSLSSNNNESKRFFFLEYSNKTGELVVPKGKSWYIGSCFAGLIPADGNCEPMIVISKLNSTTFSNLSSSLFSKEFLDSHLNMYLPEGTSISFLIYDRCHDADYNISRKSSGITVTFNIIEYSNQ